MDSIIAAVIGVLGLLFGWFLRRLVGQNDQALAAVRADILVLQTDIRNLRDRVEVLRQTQLNHDAAHMLAGDRLDRPRSDD